MPKKGSYGAGFWEPAEEGRRGWPAWRRFHSLGRERQAVLGSSLEPFISQPRVTWMPGIPEPPGCSTRSPPPTAPSRVSSLGARGGERLGQRETGTRSGGPCFEMHISLLPPALALLSCPPRVPSWLPAPPIPTQERPSPNGLVHGSILVPGVGRCTRPQASQPLFWT